MVHQLSSCSPRPVCCVRQGVCPTVTTTINTGVSSFEKDPFCYDYLDGAGSASVILFLPLAQLTHIDYRRTGETHTLYVLQASARALLCPRDWPHASSRDNCSSSNNKPQSNEPQTEGAGLSYHSFARGFLSSWRRFHFSMPLRPSQWLLGLATTFCMRRAAPGKTSSRYPSGHHSSSSWAW